uniref:Uncharacterized protein n=1 Tax=uncultured marine virus TaxID=186617 RepID=A0A0F7L8A9_9VIRU|nr:hypothetical protein [uncultured marine virus]
MSLPTSLSWLSWPTLPTKIARLSDIYFPFRSAMASSCSLSLIIPTRSLASSMSVMAFSQMGRLAIFTVEKFSFSFRDHFRKAVGLATTERSWCTSCNHSSHSASSSRSPSMSPSAML